MAMNSVGIDRLYRIVKEGVWVASGQVLSVLGALIGVRLLTSLLNPAQYGELMLGMTVATLVNQIILGPLSHGMARFYVPAETNGELSSYFLASRRLIVKTNGVIGGGILLVSASLFFAGKAEWIGLAVAALIFATLSGYNSIINAIQNAARQRSVVAMFQGVESWARILIAIILLVWLGASSTVAMFSYGIAASLVFCSQYMFFRKLVPIDISTRESVQYWREQIWKFSSPFAAWGIFTWAQQVSDRWAIGHFGTTQDVGLYAVLFQLGYYPMSLVTGIAMQLLTPILFQKVGDSNDHQKNANVDRMVWRVAVGALVVTSVVFALAQLFHVYLFRILVAAEYASVSYLLPWMILAGGIFAASQMLSINLMCQMQTRAMRSMKIVTAIVGILLNFIGTYWYGIIGLVVAGILFAIIIFIWTASLLLGVKSVNKLSM